MTHTKERSCDIPLRAQRDTLEGGDAIEQDTCAVPLPHIPNE